MDLWYGIDLFGTFVFAISGMLFAADKNFDLVGAIIIGLVTAIGGGTLRDILIGSTPVGWMKDLNYLAVILLALPVCLLFRQFIMKLHRSIFLFDTIGIGLFTILGLEKTLSIGLSPIIALMMGVVSAVFGGVIRDVLTNEIPLIFRKEIYASACFGGGLLYLALGYVNPNQQINTVLSILLVILIRYLSVRKHWSLPFRPI